RMGVELTSHVHADGLATLYYQDFTFTHNRGTNLGRLDGYNGMLLSLSGLGKTILVSNNTVTDARFGGLEFVACQDVTASNNWFNSTGATTYSAYAISQAGSLRAQRIAISGGGGYLKGRPFVLYGTDGFTVRGGNWKSEQPTDIRATNGLFTGVRLQVTTGSEAGGGNALQLHQCTQVTITHCILTLSSSTQTNYSVVDFGPARNNTQCRLTNNTLKRPPGALDAFVHTESNHTLVVRGNIETN
ncbi:MAG: hypothetical protein JWQ74_3718, partial [Marmoricola sp.]|nr:hypothetical protein [Marmoricola sp.]